MDPREALDGTAGGQRPGDAETDAAGRAGEDGVAPQEAQGRPGFGGIGAVISTVRLLVYCRQIEICSAGGNADEI